MENLEDIYDLSPMQQGMLFHTLYAPKSGIYFEQMSITLDGPLNKRVFKQAWQQVIDRHAILRTEFYWEELDNPLQVVRKKVNLPWNELDWHEVVNPEQELKNFLAVDREQGFELHQAPLIRCALMQIASERHYFVWSFHHLLLDGWSTALLLQEVQAAYRAAVRSERLPIARPRPYKSYITWLGEQDMGQAEAYWRQALQGFTAPTPLIVDHQARANDHDQAAYSEHQVHFSKEISAALQKIAALNRLTINTVIQGTWALLLSRYSGEQDVLFGATVSGRPHELSGVERMVGLFINTLPVRVNVAVSEPLLAWLSDLQEQQREREQYAYTPLLDIQGWSDVPRGTPLFESLLVYENYPVKNESLQEKSLIQITDMGLEEQTNYPLTVIAALIEKEDGPQLYLAFSYDTSRFEHDTIERMAGHLETLLSGMVANPDQPLVELPWLTDSEKHQLLLEWNDTGMPAHSTYQEWSDQCIHQLFEQQVARTPDAMAVVFENQNLTYHQLNTRANQLAHYLMAQGLGSAGSYHVGLYVERSIEMVVGVLAILKAGGAYVPIDTVYPTERIDFMLQDSSIGILLTQSHLLAQLDSPFIGASDLQCICLTHDNDGISQQPDTNPVTPITKDDLAYIIYTSGSSGRPKGVMVTHANVTRLFAATEIYYHFEQQDVWTLFHSIAFDFSVWEVWGALLYGGRLVVVPYMVSRDPDAFYQLLCQEQVTVLNQTPSAFQQLIAAEERARDKNFALRLVIFGGEALELASLRPWVSRHGSTPQLVNMYGITETTVHVTYRPLTEADLDSTASYIGRAIGDLRLYILDQHLQPVPIGVPGELCVGGAGVSQGYLNRPELTKERFIDNPFAAGKLYRSGDRARYSPNHDIEYLGRYDHQVKIRGFRIELGEIETQLSQHESVRSVVVVVLSEPSGPGKRLVAYFVAEKPMQKDILRSYLGQKLPDYMIPKAFVQLGAMPLTTNGKIDRRALPAPEISLDSAKVVLPRTPVEKILATIWQEVLRLKQVGVTDNFFEVGGDSIISIQIVSRAKEAGINITPRDLFQHQTIKKLASVAKEVQKTDAEQGIVTGTLPLTPIQHWFLEQSWREAHHFNQSVFLELTPEVNPSWLEQAVQALLVHHDALRLRFEREGHNWRQAIVAAQGELPFEVIELSAYSNQEDEARANKLQASLNLSQGPLLRVALFSSRTVNRLLMVIHHLAVDGVSWRILLEDLQRAYQQIARGDSIQLPAKSTSFKQWATLLNEKGPSTVEAERDYWAELSATQALLIDYRLGPNDNASAATISTKLDRTQTSALLSEVPAVYQTQINDLLLTALLLAYSRWTGDTAMLLNLEGHGREELFEVDLSRTVGWFTTIFPVRLELTTFDLGETIKHVKEQLRTIPNRGIGYGILRYLSSEKLPQVDAQISFNYLGQLDQTAKGTLIKGFANQSSGLSHSPDGRRSHLLDINSMVIKGQLEVNWTYSRNHHRPETIQNLANRFINALQGLIAHCQEPEAGGYTPSDFPEVDLNQEELDDLLNGQKSGIEAIYPLSGMQEGMLFHSLYAPHSGVYFVQTAITIVGKLDRQAFKKAWQQVMARHPVLRTYFVWQQQQKPLQVVRQEVELPWTEQDWCQREDKQQQLEWYLATEREQGVELHDAPLMRFALMQISDTRYYFVWNSHHLLLDGWSTSLVLQEVWDTYHAACRGEHHDYAPPRPYKNYIAWLREQDMAQAEAYWRQSLQGFTAPTPLVVDHRARLNDDDQATYSEHQVHFSEETSAALQKLARENRLTINTIIQGTWALLLSRYSGNEDVLFGATVSGRPAELSGVEKMVGLFINTLPVRVLIKADLPLVAWLSDLQEQQREREQYAYTPLPDIQGWSDVPRGTPFFESLLVYENYPVDKESWQDASLIEITNVQSVEKTNYPLTLVAYLIEKEDGPQLYLGLSYDTSRFEQDTISRMATHFQTLLEGIVVNPNQSIGNLPLLTEREKHQLLVEWNDTAADYPSDKCIHQLFEEQVARTPDACAVVAGDQAVTYRELNARANQLAHYLIAQGVGPDVLVGICVERSIEMMIGLLGILKAGGAYVPLDPSYPDERLEFMLEDANVKVLLSGGQFLSALPQVVPLFSFLQEASFIEQDDSNPVTQVKSHHMAYCIYTSGSTGRPKGVMIQHQSLTNFLYAMQLSPGLTSKDRLLGVTTISFDIAALELYLPLVMGGQVILATLEESSDGRQLLEKLHNATIMQATPATWRMLLAAGWQEQRDIKLLCGGEALPYDLAQELISRGSQLWNMYGPTETTIWSTITNVTRELASEKMVSIGKPILNTQIYILDRHLAPVPIGVVGELYIGGAGVARGYLNRPQLTAQKFIPNPFGPGRLYKTGDLCRYLANGKIEFLGRADYQVKIRGFRIELGEIEAQLSQHELVRSVVIVARPEPSGSDKQLVAYFVAKEPIDSSALRAYLGQKLPQYMIPAAFVSLESMPLTPNGKINRRALPAPEYGVSKAELVLPRTPTEEILAAIWQEVLGIKQIGIDDNFFELGGHSLLVTQVVSRIRQQLNVELPLRHLFRAVTISKLAEAVEKIKVGQAIQDSALDNTTTREEIEI